MERFRNFFEELYKNFNSRNIEPVIGQTTEDVQWANGMEGGYVFGHNGIREYWTRQFTMIDAEVTPLEVNSDGDDVKIKVHQLVRDLDGHILFDKNIYHHFHMDHEKVARFEIGDDVVD